MRASGDEPACRDGSQPSASPRSEDAAGQGTGNRESGIGDGRTDCHDQSADWSRNDSIGTVSVPGSAAPNNSQFSTLNAQFSFPPAWDALLDHPFDRPPHRNTLAAAEAAAALETVYPPRADWFAALRLTPPERVRAVILGQDPYHEPNQAMGLAFSVRPGVKLPPSLRNIYKELEGDLGLPAPASGDLTPWAEQGVLLLNTVLTVAAGRANSHKNLGWQALTREILAALSRLPQPVAFLLWGAPAQRAYAQATEPVAAHSVRHPCEGIGNRQQATGDVGCEAAGNREQGTGDGEREATVTYPLSLVTCHLSPVPSPAPRLILTAPHPSPLSAYRGFFGSRPFSQVNEFLKANGEAPIRWTE